MNAFLYRCQVETSDDTHDPVLAGSVRCKPSAFFKPGNAAREHDITSARFSQVCQAYSCRVHRAFEVYFDLFHVWFPGPVRLGSKYILDRDHAGISHDNVQSTVQLIAQRK